MSFATEEHKSTKQKILEAGASLLQSKDPVKSFKQHLAAVYFVAGDLNRQVLLHSYLNSFNEEFGHALLYDGERSDSKLVGIQYIISERVFLTLPEVEKKLWHSFHYMVKNGLIVAPSLPSVAEQPLMTHLATCYGKTFLFWDTTVSPLPYGIPQMMMSFTSEGQVNEMYVKQLYADADVNPSSLLKKREKTSTPVIHPGADSWRTGEVYQLRLENISSQSNSIPSNNMSSTMPQTSSVPPTSSIPLTPITPLTTPTTNATTPLSVPQYAEASISHPVGIPTAYGQSNSSNQSPYYPTQQGGQQYGNQQYGNQQYQQYGNQQFPQQGTQQYGNQQYQQYGNQQGTSYPSYSGGQQSMSYGAQSTTTPSTGDQQRSDYSSFSSPNDNNNTNNSNNDSSSSSTSTTSPTSFNSSSSPSTSSTKAHDVLIEKKITTTSYSPTKDNTPSSLLTTTTTITKKADAKTD